MLLALAWPAYIPIIAGGIVTVGGAVTVLTGWGRGALSLGRRMRSRTRPVQAKPTAEQVAVLNAVHRYFLEHGHRPSFRHLDKLLDREALELRKHVDAMPPGFLTP